MLDKKFSYKSFQAQLDYSAEAYNDLLSELREEIRDHIKAAVQREIAAIARQLNRLGHDLRIKKEDIGKCETYWSQKNVKSGDVRLGIGLILQPYKPFLDENGKTPQHHAEVIEGTEYAVFIEHDVSEYDFLDIDNLNFSDPVYDIIETGYKQSYSKQDDPNFLQEMAQNKQSLKKWCKDVMPDDPYEIK